MVKKYIYILFPLLVLGILSACKGDRKERDDQKKVEQIISLMTLEQKAQLVIGTGMNIHAPDSIKGLLPPVLTGEIMSDDTTYVAMVKQVRGYLPGSAGVTCEFPGKGITSQVLSDGPAGLRIQPERKDDNKTYYCTAFPIATMLASTWDTSLVFRVGQAMGNEVKEYGSDILLAPALNIQRDPLCGRNFEYYSEDPLISGKMAAAMVRGVQSNGVGTSVKHFAANNSETNRMSVNTIVSTRALREIYLRGFEIAVKESQPWTVMSSYNKINGTYTSESHDLLTKILRDDWGFEGYVMTDWGGGSNVVSQINAGNDMVQPGQPAQFEELVKAVKDGKLQEEVLDKAVGRIINIMLKTPRYNGAHPTNMPDMEGHATVVRQIASEGMVLLKNEDGALPIPSNAKNIAAFGITSYRFISGGTGSGDVNEAYTVSLADGLKNRGYALDDRLSTIYGNYIREAEAIAGQSKNTLAALMGVKESLEEMVLPQGLAVEVAEKNEMALITIGRNSGEGGDRQAVAGDFYLTEAEKVLIKGVSEAFHSKGKKVAVILNIGSVIETASWRDWPDAILLAWQPGQEAGNSVADILSGEVNPSGKLAISFPLSYNDAPTYQNFPGEMVESDEQDNTVDLSGFSFMKRVPWKITYQEDIYVGYRYYNTFEVPVAYEFGYGLSYTHFDYSNLRLDKISFDDNLTVTVDIKNTGAMAGKEVVQVYATAPAGKLDKPEKELVAFAKTRLLEPGESETLTFIVTARNLTSFDETRSSWIAEPGKYTLKVGASSTKIMQKASFELSHEIVADKVSKALMPKEYVEWLKVND